MIHIPLETMQPSASRLLWVIFISSCISAYGQKCDLVLYSAPCGAAPLHHILFLELPFSVALYMMLIPCIYQDGIGECHMAKAQAIRT